LVGKALHYEERRGPHSVGGHVRDAAAYVCWAFARAYKPDAMADSVHVLTPSLLKAACYDREVSCRRAASAAFQEMVGRLGAQHFPNGIEILTSADYFTLGSRRHAYTIVGPMIATLPQYLVPLAEHLLTNKLQAWDAAIRELAAEGLASLVPLQPCFFADVALPMVVNAAVEAPTLEARHGGLLAAATLPSALKSAGFKLQRESTDSVINVVLAVQAKQLVRGKGGELMRVGLCKLIAAIARMNVPLQDCQVRLQLYGVCGPKTLIVDQLREYTCFSSAACMLPLDF
jgi:tubulin-specific chaperone D